MQEASRDTKPAFGAPGLTSSLTGHFDEAIDYIERHDLYIPALRLWSDRPEELKVK